MVENQTMSHRENVVVILYLLGVVSNHLNVSDAAEREEFVEVTRYSYILHQMCWDIAFMCHATLYPIIQRDFLELSTS